jgi:hypothetical protein
MPVDMCICLATLHIYTCPQGMHNKGFSLNLVFCSLVENPFSFLEKIVTDIEIGRHERIICG